MSDIYAFSNKTEDPPERSPGSGRKDAFLSKPPWWHGLLHAVAWAAAAAGIVCLIAYAVIKIGSGGAVYLNGGADSSLKSGVELNPRR